MASRGRSNFSAKVRKYGNGRSDSLANDFPDDGNNKKEGTSFNNYSKVDDEEEEALRTSKRFSDIEALNAQDEQFGFILFASGPAKTGWIINMKSVILSHVFFKKKY